MRRIPFVNKCIKNINKKDFMKYCNFACSQFKLFSDSYFFDGNLKMLNSILTRAMSFVNKILNINAKG